VCRHGAKQPRYPWSDGPEFVTQCPIRPGTSFSQRIVLSDEIGSMWWHAHSEWSRATVHGLLIVYPQRGDNYPFPNPYAEVPLVLGEWWRRDIEELFSEFTTLGNDPLSDAYLMNGQPGDLYNCSQADTFKLAVEQGKTYLVRMVNAAMHNILFFAIARHKITVVGTDGAYTKPLERDYIAISPGQTIDFLLEANQEPDHYYIAASPYSSVGSFSNSTTTAIIEYRGNYTPSSRPIFPTLPVYNDTSASFSFTRSLRSLASREHPIDVPRSKNMTKLFFALSVNTLSCETIINCTTRFGASINNISFVTPNIDILEAYYNKIHGVYGDEFPGRPPLEFNYTADDIPIELWTPQLGTEVKVLEYNADVELVFQSTSLLAGIDHPMHLHGYSFYVVGSGLGNYNASNATYNLDDPPLKNTIAIPRRGWTAIRFKANNPGVWFMHCHFERHVTWGMAMAFIIKDGKRPEEKMLPPPPDMPRC
jgi:laccase